ncbi:MAG TPA: pyridoxal-dependent decarboxylase [Acidobacteriota bacterium]|nr:pyridoxal-dependent decarboxylase [Acidobacteriota bacterium]
MSTMPKAIEELTLDPQDWDAVERLGHRMVSDMMAYLKEVRQRPVWQPVPPEVRQTFEDGPPMEPRPLEDIYQDFVHHILPYPAGNIHPRFWGWVIGNGTVSGVLAEMLAAAMNSNVFGGDQAPGFLENQVIGWFKQIYGYEESTSGLLVSGGSMANLLALAVARNAMAGMDMNRDGIRAAAPLTLYASVEAHSSIVKAVQLLGLGGSALRSVAVNDRFEIDLHALEDRIQEDLDSGRRPFCVIGNAGTVNTGATDNLRELSRIAKKYGTWFHVDGSFGSFAVLSPELRHLVDGIDQADSLTFCLHKWMYMQYEASCVLIRQREQHHKTFAHAGSYLSHTEGGFAGAGEWFNEYGMQLSRGFRALKVWFAIREHGLRTYGKLIQQNAEQARYLGRRIESTPELELLAPVPLNVVCFRYRFPVQNEAQLNQLNERLLIEVQKSGVALPSFTRIHGKAALRVAVTNHRSRLEDFDLFLDTVLHCGRHLAF